MKERRDRAYRIVDTKEQVYTCIDAIEHQYTIKQLRSLNVRYGQFIEAGTEEVKYIIFYNPDNAYCPRFDVDQEPKRMK